MEGMDQPGRRARGCDRTLVELASVYNKLLALAVLPIYCDASRNVLSSSTARSRSDRWVIALICELARACENLPEDVEYEPMMARADPADGYRLWDVEMVALLRADRVVMSWATSPAHSYHRDSAGEQHLAPVDYLRSIAYRIFAQPRQPRRGEHTVHEIARFRGLYAANYSFVGNACGRLPITLRDWVILLDRICAYLTSTACLLHTLSFTTPLPQSVLLHILVPGLFANMARMRASFHPYLSHSHRRPVPEYDRSVYIPCEHHGSRVPLPHLAVSCTQPSEDRTRRCVLRRASSAYARVQLITPPPSGGWTIGTFKGDGVVMSWSERLEGVMHEMCRALDNDSMRHAACTCVSMLSMCHSKPSQGAFYEWSSAKRQPVLHVFSVDCVPWCAWGIVCHHNNVELQEAVNWNVELHQRRLQRQRLYSTTLQPREASDGCRTTAEFTPPPPRGGAPRIGPPRVSTLLLGKRTHSEANQPQTTGRKVAKISVPMGKFANDASQETIAERLIQTWVASTETAMVARQLFDSSPSTSEVTRLLHPSPEDEFGLFFTCVYNAHDELESTPRARRVLINCTVCYRAFEYDIHGFKRQNVSHSYMHSARIVRLPDNISMTWWSKASDMAENLEGLETNAIDRQMGMALCAIFKHIVHYLAEGGIIKVCNLKQLASQRMIVAKYVLLDNGSMGGEDSLPEPETKSETKSERPDDVEPEVVHESEGEASDAGVQERTSEKTLDKE